MPDPQTSVPRDQAADSAWQALQLFLTTDEAGPYAETWSVFNLPEGGGNLFGQNSTTIFDYKGRPLFYEFSLALQNGNEFRARAAADKALASPVLQMAATKPFDIAAWRKNTLKFAADNGFTIDNPEQIICYAVPKLGLLARDPSNRQFVIDLAAPVAIPVPSALAPMIPDELLLVWSPLDLVEAGNKNATLFDTKLHALNSIALSSTHAAFALNQPLNQPPATQNVLALTLVGQETPVYCACASAQMILAFHNIQVTQDTIATAMQTGPGGSTLANELMAYAQLSNNAFTGTLTKPVTFGGDQQQINKNMPLKSGVPGHARVSAGWKTQTTGGTTSSWLYIYDPWPPNSGQVYWEDMSAVIHTNDIYIDPGSTA
jgi:hypothetical protein